jgi:hypothetical protein
MTLWIDQPDNQPDIFSRELAALLGSLLFRQSDIIEALEDIPKINLGNVWWPSGELTASEFWNKCLPRLRSELKLRDFLYILGQSFPARRQDFARFLTLEASDDTEQFTTLESRLQEPAPMLEDASTPVDVVEPLVNAHLADVQALAPKELHNRYDDVKAIEQFALLQRGSWWGWRADPWAGKTALMATLALNPPQGLQAVSFFVLGREALANTRARFYAQIIPQLASLLGWRTVRRSADPVGVRAQFWDLLRRAAHTAEQRGTRLLLLLDGLDEDAALIDPRAGRGSIAATLPLNPPSGVCVVVSSRPNPPLPYDVPSNHPIRDPHNWHKLDPSSAATVAHTAAESDLLDLISSKLGKKLAATIAAAGAPLTCVDLAEITDSDYLKVTRLIASRSARALVPVISSLNPEYPLSYRLGHEKLDELLIHNLDPRSWAAPVDRSAWRSIRFAALGPWRELIYRWALQWANRGWPGGTPGYLLEGSYPALLLQDETKKDELVTLLTDGRRLNRLYRMNLADYASLNQIRNVVNEVLTTSTPDLAVTGPLLVTAERLSTRSDRTPTFLLELLTALGRTTQAVDIAAGTSDAFRRVRAMIVVATTCIRTSALADGWRIAQLARSSLKDIPIANRDGPARALRQIISVAAQEQARSSSANQALNGWATDPDFTDSTLPVFPPLQRDRAASSRIDSQIGNLLPKAAAHIRSAGFHAAGVLLLEAVQKVGYYQIDEMHVQELIRLLDVAEFNDPVLLWGLLIEMHGPANAFRGAVEVVRGFAFMNRDPGLSCGLGRQMLLASEAGYEKAARVRALGYCTIAFMVAGDTESASDVINTALGLLGELATVGGSLASAYLRRDVWGELIRAVSLVNGVDDGLLLAKQLLSGHALQQVLVSVTQVALLSSFSTAERILDQITDPYPLALALTLLAEHASNEEMVERLRQKAPTEMEPRARVLAALAIAARRHSQNPMLSGALAKSARDCAYRCSSPTSRRRALIFAVGSLAAAGLAEEARSIIGELGIAVDKVEALAGAGLALARTGQADRALLWTHEAGMAAGLIHYDERGSAQVDVAHALAALGRADYALDLVEAVPATPEKLRALIAVSHELTPTHNTEARRLTDLAHSLIVWAPLPLEHPRGLIAIGAELNKSGFRTLAESLLHRAVEQAEGMERDIDRALILAAGVELMNEYSSRDARRMLLTAWASSTCPWLGWPALAKISPGTIRVLSDLLIVELAHGV